MGTRSHCSPEQGECVVNPGFRHALGPPPPPTAGWPHPFRGPNRARLSVSLDPHFFSDGCRSPLSPRNRICNNFRSKWHESVHLIGIIEHFLHPLAVAGPKASRDSPSRPQKKIENKLRNRDFGGEIQRMSLPIARIARIGTLRPHRTISSIVRKQPRTVEPLQEGSAVLLWWADRAPPARLRRW